MPSFYSLPYARHFRAGYCSGVAFLALFLAAFALIVPYIWANATGSFWIKVNSYREQPTVAYMRDFIVFLEGQSSKDGSSVNMFFSSNPNINQLFDHSVDAVPVVKTSEVDEDRDGVFDYLKFSISMPMLDNYEIYKVRFAFFLRYELVERIRVLMQSMAAVEISNTSPSARVIVDGDLRLQQRALLDVGIDSIEYNKPVMNYTLATTGATSKLFWPNIVKAYNDRNCNQLLYHSLEVTPYVVKTTFEVMNGPTWMAPRGIQQPFVIEGKLRYVEEQILYRPGVLEVLKFGWIQYVAHFAVAAAVAWFVYGWFVIAQVVPTYVVVDTVPKNVGFKSQPF